MADTIYEAFLRSARAWPQNDFLFIPESATRGWADRRLVYSYEAAGREIEALKARYAEAGIGLGHRVATLLENRDSFFFHWLALNALGASLVPINPDYRAEELSYLLSHSEAVLAVSLPHRVADIARAAEAAGRKIPVIDAESAKQSVPHVPAAAAKGGSGGRGTPRQNEAALLYTSGTTGRPKGCIISNDYCLRLADWYATEGGYIKFEPGKTRILTPLPMFHMNALCCSSMAMIAYGGCIIQLDRFHPKSWWKDVSESGATIVHYLGVMPAILLQLPPSEYDTKHKVICGFGSNVEPEHHLAFEKRYGFPLVEGWAMTEGGAGSVIMCSQEPRHIGTRCFGKVPDRVKLRVVDDNDRDVPDGEPGEMILQCAGPDPRAGFFSGYLKDEAATEEGWRGGWWHTGDVVRKGPDGSMHFVDRKKNVIRRSGENIAALEVEGVLQRHPVIAQVGVTSVPDNVRGEEVIACIVPKPDSAADRATAEGIVRWTLEKLAYYKAPGWVAFVDAVPLTATLKIQRADLKRLGETLLDRPKTFDTRAMKKRGAEGG